MSEEEIPYVLHPHSLLLLCLCLEGEGLLPPVELEPGGVAVNALTQAVVTCLHMGTLLQQEDEHGIHVGQVCIV